MNPRPLLLASLALASAFSSAAFAQIYTNPTSGDVGIGTTSPGTKLEVKGDELRIRSIVSKTDGTSRGLLRLTSDDTVAANNLEMLFTLQGGAVGGGRYGQIQVADNGYYWGALVLNPYGGNVGIGTNNPISVLQLSRAGETRLVLMPHTGENNRESLIDFWSTFDNYPADAGVRRVARVQAGFDGGTWGTEYLAFGVAASGDAANPPAERMRINAAGNVGVGTTSPAEKLHVIGNALLNGSLLLRGGGHLVVQFRNSDSTIDQRFSEVAESSGVITFRTLNDAYSEACDWLRVYRSAGSYNIDRITFPSSANVGIGTTNPTHKLAVNGTIKAKEVIVETTGWSDYVFADDYALAPLTEVEAHIKEHKHLPGIPSAAQVADQGVSVGDMQARLLAKVEELTLHLIAQEKELSRLRESEKKLAALESKLQQLERLSK